MISAVRRDSTCSFYQPPPPTDVERMRNNMIKEQKVFALIREILGRKTHFGTWQKRVQRSWCEPLIICLWFSIRRLYVDVAPGGIWPEGPQRFLSNPAHPTELQQRHLGQHEHPGCLHLGKHHSAEQPVWGIPRSDCWKD